MTFGDLYWIEFPTRGGHAQAGRRPAIIFQGANGEVPPTVLVVPLTTQQEALRFPGTTVVTPDAQNGLRRLSIALVFQVTAIDRRFVGEQIGRASDDVLARIRSALNELMDDAR